MESVLPPCVHEIEAAPVCVPVDGPPSVELADDDASASVDDAVELAAPLALAIVLVLVEKMPAPDPSEELITYVPPLP